MRDGEIRDGFAWFRLDARELEWLYSLVSEGDEFKKMVALAMRRLEESEKEQRA